MLRPFCVLVLTVAAALAAAQGIRTSVAELDLPGQWQERPEWLAGIEAPGGHVYYDAASTAVVHLRPGDASWAEADLTAVIAQLREMEQGAVSYPSVARVISSAFFPLPAAYRQRVTRTNPGRRGFPRLWETDAAAGNAQLFYASQLTTGLSARKVGKDTYYSEDFVGLRLIAGERRAAGSGEAVVFEMETAGPAIPDATARFEIAAAAGARLRYGWVLYAPASFKQAAGMVSVGYAAPAGSAVNAEAIVEALAASRR
jgi:hypothetical protein